MLSEFRKEKMMRLFEFYDINENGYIEDLDIDEISRTFAEEFEWQLEDEAYKKFAHNFKQLWLQLVNAADTNYDGRITPAEFLANYEITVADDAAFQTYMLPFWELIYHLLDPHETHFISKDNYMRFYRAFRNSSKAAQRAFVAMDLNGDGYVSKNELYQNFYNFHMSENPEDVSKLFFGMWVK